MATPTNISDLPKEAGWVDGDVIFQYQGFWYQEIVLEAMLALRDHFPAEPADILLASFPKSGTTWLKALLISITGGTQNSPLLTANPHELVPVLEFHAAENPEDLRPNSPSSILHTHIPFGSLPESIKESGCKIVYVFRDPKDVIVSYWHFAKKLKFQGTVISLETAFQRFCRGTLPNGPYWDHVLEYWKASLEFPERVFFLRYEELKKEPWHHTKRLSEFLGCPLVEEAMIEKVVDLCSFEKLSSLEVNRSGNHTLLGSVGIDNNVFFRQGHVGDSKNHLTASMMDEIDEITKDKFKEFPQLINNMI